MYNAPAFVNKDKHTHICYIDVIIWNTTEAEEEEEDTMQPAEEAEELECVCPHGMGIQLVNIVVLQFAVPIDLWVTNRKIHCSTMVTDWPRLGK